MSHPLEAPRTGWLIAGAMVAVLALPFTGLLPLYQWPAGVAAANSPLVVWHALAIVGLTVWIWPRDRWLAAFAAYIALDALRAPVPARAWLMADAVALGAAAFVLLRRMEWPWTELVRAMLGVSAWGQAVVASLQWLGWDPFYAADAPYRAAGTMPGTIGNDTWLGAYLALVGAVAPRWALPACVGGLLLARNRLGLVALAVALLVRFLTAPGPRLGSTALNDWHMPRSTAWRSRVAVGTLIAGAAGAGWWWTDKTYDTLFTRLEAWRQGVIVWWQHGILFGLGPGAWAWYLPQFDQREHFVQAHSEYDQLLFEGGAVGLLLALGWVWAHRTRLVGHPGAWALAILCVATFPFHVAIVAATAVIVLALPCGSSSPS